MYSHYPIIGYLDKGTLNEGILGEINSFGDCRAYALQFL